MRDLAVLVADANMKAAMEAILVRDSALGIRKLQFDITVHPRRDPGCFHEGPDFLRGFRPSHEHALLVLDRAFAGAPLQAAEIERKLSRDFEERRFGGWAHAIVIEPELEAWVFSDSPHVAEALGWSGRTPDLATWLREGGFWEPGRVKPEDPKRAVDEALREARVRRSSSIYRTLAGKVSLQRCRDASFLNLRGVLQQWFPIATAPSD